MAAPRAAAAGGDQPPAALAALVAGTSLNGSKKNSISSNASSDSEPPSSASTTTPSPAFRQSTPTEEAVSALRRISRWFQRHPDRLNADEWLPRLTPSPDTPDEHPSDPSRWPLGAPRRHSIDETARQRPPRSQGSPNSFRSSGVFPASWRRTARRDSFAGYGYVPTGTSGGGGGGGGGGGSASGGGGGSWAGSSGTIGGSASEPLHTLHEEEATVASGGACEGYLTVRLLPPAAPLRSWWVYRDDTLIAYPAREATAPALPELAAADGAGAIAPSPDYEHAVVVTLDVGSRTRLRRFSLSEERWTGSSDAGVAAPSDGAPGAPGAPAAAGSVRESLAPLPTGPWLAAARQLADYGQLVLQADSADEQQAWLGALVQGVRARPAPAGVASALAEDAAGVPQFPPPVPSALTSAGPTPQPVSERTTALLAAMAAAAGEGQSILLPLPTRHQMIVGTAPPSWLGGVRAAWRSGPRADAACSLVTSLLLRGWRGSFQSWWRRAAWRRPPTSAC